MSNINLKLGAAVTAICAGMTVAPVAQAVDYAVSGHVNRMIRFADDKAQSDTQHVDNGANASRLSVSANGEFAGMDVEAFAQLRINTNSSEQASIRNDVSGNNQSRVAYADIRFNTDWGKISMGRGDGAARFAQRQDLSGTELADNFDNRRITMLDLRERVGGNLVLSGFHGDHVIGSFEGEREDRLRYDTPAFGGAIGSVSFGEGRSYELGLTFDSALEAASSSAAGGSSSAEGGSSFWDGMRFIGAIGYRNDGTSVGSNPGATEESIAASGSILFPGGFNLTLGYGEESFLAMTPGGQADKDVTGTYIKPGYRWGNHAISLSYGQNTDLDNGDYDGESTIFAYQYNGAGGVDVYAAYGIYGVNGNNGLQDTEDLKVFNVGTRIRF